MLNGKVRRRGQMCLRDRGLAAQMLSWLKQHGVREVVLAGTVARPSLLSLRPDAASMKLIGRIGRAAFNGDDSILRAVMKVLGEEGFEVVGAQALLTGLLPEAALLAGPMPDDVARADIARGLAVCHAHHLNLPTILPVLAHEVRGSYES